MKLFQHPFPSRNDFDGLPVLLNNLFIMMSYDEEIVALSLFAKLLFLAFPNTLDTMLSLVVLVALRSRIP